MQIGNFAQAMAFVTNASRRVSHFDQVSHRRPVRIDRVPPEPRICNLQFFSLTLLLVLSLAPAVRAQVTPDKIVATVTNGSQTTPDVITYSDLVWQLTLEGKRPFNPRPTSEALNQALSRLEDQLLILQEAKKLPLAQSPAAQRDFETEVEKQRSDLLADFSSPQELRDRMTQVGLTSEHLDQILRDRATSAKYIEFRFRAFAVVSAKEISDRYEEETAKLRGTGVIVPTLDQLRDKIEAQLTEEKILDAIDKFTDELRDQSSTEIIVLNPV